MTGYSDYRVISVEEVIETIRQKTNKKNPFSQWKNTELEKLKMNLE